MTFPRKKPKKPIALWRQNILSHHQSNPSRSDRNEFPLKVLKELIEEADGKCQCGCGKPDQSTHHVMPRGRDGRGVKTNGMRVNNICHDRIQTDEEELQRWIKVYRERHGNYFWYDGQDWEEHNRKLANESKLQLEKQQRMDEIEPVVTLLSTAAGRALRAKEIRLIDTLANKDINTLAKLMHDVVEASNHSTIKESYSYGERFED